MNWGIVLSKLVDLNPVSVVSILFTILYLSFTKFWMNRLTESHDKAIEHIRGAYSDSVNVLKDHIKINIPKKR